MDSATLAQELRSARLALGLSQGQVSRDTGISRSQLSLFEARKYLLDRSKIGNLRAYYSKRGYRFRDPTKGPSINPAVPSGAGNAESVSDSDIDLLDGFGVAGGIERARAEAWLDQIAANDDVIGELLATPTATHAWSGDPKTEQRDEALLQMARNYALVRRLHGKDILPPPRAAKDTTQLTGDLVRELFWGKDYSDQARPVSHSSATKHRKRRVAR